MSNYGDNREGSKPRVTTLSGNDLIRVVVGGSSRNITRENFVSVLNPLLNSTLDVVTSTTNYTATIANQVILMDVTSGTLSVTLPSASTSANYQIQIKKIDGSTNDVTVQTAGGNIDGAATATLSGSGGARPGAAFISDGSNWYILNA